MPDLVLRSFSFFLTELLPSATATAEAGSIGEVLLENARSVARRSSSELTNFDVGTAEEPLILTDAQMTMP